MATVEVNGRPRYYERVGEGPLLLLISPCGWSGEHWRQYQVPALSPSFEVLTFDHPGTGRSAGAPRGVSTRALGREVVGLLEALDLVEPALMLGLGSGGGVLQWVCLDEPEAVRAVAFVASSPGQFDERVVPRHLDVESIAALAEQGWPGYLERYLSGPELFVDVDPDALAVFLAAHRGEYATELRHYLAHLEAALQHETTARLEEIEAPALVLVGDRDEVAPEGAPCRIESSLALASRLFYSEYIEIEDAALGLHIERPDAFHEAVLDFLVRH